MCWTPYKNHRPHGEPKYKPLRVSANGKVTKIMLTPEQEEAFRRLYPRTFNSKIVDLFGVSCSTVHRLARELGVKKDMKTIGRKAAAAAKKTCEKNGYYESIRGKRLSDACLEASKRAREGKPHPLKVMKAKSPRKYAKLMAKLSEKRKELFRKEELRQRYGLTRHTKLHLRTTTHRMSVQKCVMIKKKNYFADPTDPTVVCYDSLTRRCPRMEATAIKHGLKVVEGSEE